MSVSLSRPDLQLATTYKKFDQEALSPKLIDLSIDASPGAVAIRTLRVFRNSWHIFSQASHK